MPLILPGNVGSATAAVGYNVANSCRFNSGDSPALVQTPSAGNVDRWTLSMWLKRTDQAASHRLLTCVNGSNYTEMGINASDILFWNEDQSGVQGALAANRKIRDVAAWMHLVFTWDSANGVAGNRMRLYINGTEETNFSTDTNPSSGQDSIMGTAVPVTIGSFHNSSNYQGCYFAEVAYCNGQAYAASDFGEFDEDSPTQWKPKDVSELTFGTGGFYLDFEDSADLGKDVSGQGNDFTVSNLAATDQATDTPTNNFCTWNPLKTSDASGPGDSVFSEGNTELDDGSGESAVWGTMGVSTGKWYFEYRMKHSADVNTYVGARSFDENDQIALDPETDGYIDGFTFKFGNDGTGSGGSGTDGYVNGYQNGTRATIDSGTHIQDDQILGVNLDLDDGEVYLQINGSDIYSGNSVCDLRTGTGVFFTPFVKHTSASIDYIQLNTGGASPYTLSSAVNDGNGYGNFEYAPKSGYLALCTKNLAEEG